MLIEKEASALRQKPSSLMDKLSGNRYYSKTRQRLSYLATMTKLVGVDTKLYNLKITASFVKPSGGSIMMWY